MDQPRILRDESVANGNHTAKIPTQEGQFELHWREAAADSEMRLVSCFHTENDPESEEVVRWYLYVNAASMEDVAVGRRYGTVERRGDTTSWYTQVCFFWQRVGAQYSIPNYSIVSRENYQPGSIANLAPKMLMTATTTLGLIDQIQSGEFDVLFAHSSPYQPHNNGHQ